MKTYYLILEHRFEAPFNAGIGKVDYPGSSMYRKIHTIRGNYDLWSKRFAKILSGEACLSVRVWDGRPYGKGSTQRELACLTRDDGIGLQDLFVKSCFSLFDRCFVDGSPVNDMTLAHRDGLSLLELTDLLGSVGLDEPLALIHFTPFRY